MSRNALRIVRDLDRRPDPGRVALESRRALPYVSFTETYEQGFRVADDALDVFELYVGEGAPPDFDASDQPVATSPTLPFSWTPTLPSSGDLTLYCVVRRRNKYDLESFNVFSTVLTFVAHVASLGPITAPFTLAVYDGATGYLRCVGKYDGGDDANPADAWDLYVKIGSDPVPGVDTPTFTGAMTAFGFEAGFAQTVGPWTPGAVAHVILTAKRTADGARASTSVVLHTLAELLDLTEAELFNGSADEQE